MNFRLEQKPGENPCYVHQENGTEVVIYYGAPPQRTRGVWVSVRIPRVAVVLGALLRPLERFDAAELAAIAQGFELDIRVNQ